MKKILKPVIITLILLAGLTAGAFFLLRGSKSADSEFDARRVSEENDQGDNHAYRFDTDTNAIELKRTGEDKNVLNFDNSNIFTMNTTNKARERLDRLIKRSDASFEKPLIALNPFGTNPNTYYFYFETAYKCMVRYTITVPDEEIKDHIRYVYYGTSGNTSFTHEFVVGGLVPGMTNYIILETLDETGSHREDHTYKIDIPSAGIPSVLPYIVGRSENLLTSGLFFMLPKGDKQIYMYDNNGVMRGTLATESAHGKRFYNTGSQIVYQVSPTKVVRVGNLGNLTGVTVVKGVSEIKDFAYDGYENVFSLVKVKKKYYIYRTSFETGETAKVYTFPKGVTPSSVADSVSGSLYVSCKKPAGVIRVDGLVSSKPKAGAVFGKKDDWKKTSLKKKVKDPSAVKKSDDEEGETSDTDTSGAENAEGAEGDATDADTAGGEDATDESTDAANQKSLPFVDWDLSDTILYNVRSESSGSEDVLSFAVKKNGVTYAEKVRLATKKSSAEIINEKETDLSGRAAVQWDGEHCILVGCSFGTYEERDDLFQVTRQFNFVKEFDGLWKSDLTGFSNY